MKPVCTECFLAQVTDLYAKTLVIHEKESKHNSPTSDTGLKAAYNSYMSAGQPLGLLTPFWIPNQSCLNTRVRFIFLKYGFIQQLLITATAWLALNVLLHLNPIS